MDEVLLYACTVRFKRPISVTAKQQVAPTLFVVIVEPQVTAELIPHCPRSLTRSKEAHRLTVNAATNKNLEPCSFQHVRSHISTSREALEPPGRQEADRSRNPHWLFRVTLALGNC
jgi:hypothetical protein